MDFSVPVLHEILPNPYLSHFADLVAAVQLLSSRVITQEAVGNARSYLSSFYKDAGTLYG